MTKIRKYFNCMADELEIKAKSSGLTNNKSDIGHNTECITKDFLTNHLPRRLDAVLGGTIFGRNVPDSKQIDIIVCNDISMNFRQRKKMFVPIESVASAITVKSVLDKTAIKDALKNLASIPQADKEIVTFKDTKEGIFEQFIQLHPTLFVFAFKGLSPKKTLEHITEFYKNNDVPENRKARGVIVNKKFILTYNSTDHVKKTTGGGGIQPKNYHINDLTTAKDMEGYPFVHLMHAFCSYVDWLPIMTIRMYRHFNAGYGFKD